MIDITDKKILEKQFADDFGSPYFPILAEIYFQEGDLKRALKVCEIGLDHDSSNTDGKFIIARVALEENTLIKAEKWLKRVVEDNTGHFNALRLLIKLEFELKRSNKTIKKYIYRLLKFLPDDRECKEWLLEIQAHEPIDNKTIISSHELKTNNNESRLIIDHEKEKLYEVVESMATFSMVQVLKSQKHYNQALAVLDKLKSNGADGNRIAKEIDGINLLVDKIQKNN